MFRTPKRLVAAAAASGMFAAALAGCGSKPAPVEPASGPAAAPKGLSAADAERRIQEIQNNPNMPPQAKESAIQAIRQSQVGGAAPPGAPAGR